jgi:hypothetical protein
MGTPYAEPYKVFRKALEDFLREPCRANPRIIGVNEYPSANPLTKICDVLKTCHGVIIVAYERKFVETGEEKRIGITPKAVRNQTYTTPWNHIESAMAFSLGLPLYIICETGLTEEGLIETKADWYVQHMDLTPQALLAPAVAESLRTWIAERVVPHAKGPRMWRAIEGNLKLSEMTPKEIASGFGLIAACVALGASLDHWLPALFAG